jgi:hypothetical protein
VALKRPRPGSSSHGLRLTFVLTLATVTLAGVACGKSSSTTVTKSATVTVTSRPRAVATLSASVGRSLPTRQVTLVGRVNGRFGGYRAVVFVTDAERSVTNPGDGILLRLRGGVGVPEIGSLRVTCGATPRSRFVFTKAALGEGPPRIYHETTPTSDRI